MERRKKKKATLQIVREAERDATTTTLHSIGFLPNPVAKMLLQYSVVEYLRNPNFYALICLEIVWQTILISPHVI